MKTLEQLAMFSTSDLASILPPLLVKEVKEKAEPKLIWKQLMRVRRVPAGASWFAGRKLVIPYYEKGVKAVKVSEGASLTTALGDYQEGTFSYKEVEPVKFGTAIKITWEMIKLKDINAVERLMDDVARALAVFIDTECYKTILGVTQVVNEEHDIGGAGTHTIDLGHDRVLKVRSVTLDGTSITDYTVDYYDGKLKVTTDGAGTLKVTYDYTSLDLCIDATTKGTLDYDDIALARHKVIAHNWNPNAIIIPPYADYSLVKQATFTEVGMLTERIFERGVIGRIYGLEVIVSSLAPDVAVVGQFPEPFEFYNVRDLTTYEKEDPDLDAQEYYFYQSIATTRLWDDAVAIVFNIAENSEDIS